MKLKDAKPNDIVDARGISLILENHPRSDLDGFWTGEPVIKFIDLHSASMGAALRSYKMADECRLITGKERHEIIAAMLNDIVEAYTELGGYTDMLKDLSKDIAKLSDEHVCKACGIPTTPADPAELEKEYIELYGENPDPNDVCYVCDDCYQKFLDAKAADALIMKAFPHFNQDNDAVCPMCKTNEDCETVLVPIPGTEEGNIMQARQVHKKCYDLAVRKLVEITEIAEKTGQYE